MGVEYTLTYIERIESSIKSIAILDEKSIFPLLMSVNFSTERREVGTMVALLPRVNSNARIISILFKGSVAQSSEYQGGFYVLP
jgi:hypothetical protein